MRSRNAHLGPRTASNPERIKVTIYDNEARLSTGETKSIADYRGKVLLIVNVGVQVRLHPAVPGTAEPYTSGITRAAWKSSPSPVTSSPTRSRAATPRYARSARPITA